MTDESSRRARERRLGVDRGGRRLDELRRAGSRLDLPRAPGRGPLLELDPDLFGRFSERFARFMGTGRFIVWMTVFVVLWIGWNSLAPAALRFDHFPFIFLTLMLSLQASYAAPLILLAQNRQEARDRVQYEQDRDISTQTRTDIEFLAREISALRLAVGDVATRDFLRSELRTQLAEHTNGDQRAGSAPRT